jgi:hypothetical protein
MSISDWGGLGGDRDCGSTSGQAALNLTLNPASTNVVPCNRLQTSTLKAIDLILNIIMSVAKQGEVI